jgi:MtN3 and saliva related transmembrane protein
MDRVTVVGILASVGIAVSLLPQVFKIIKEKKAKGISPVMLIVLLVSSALWMYYGLLKEDWIIIGSNGFSFLLNGFICILKVKYK